MGCRTSLFFYILQVVGRRAGGDDALDTFIARGGRHQRGHAAGERGRGGVRVTRRKVAFYAAEREGRSVEQLGGARSGAQKPPSALPEFATGVDFKLLGELLAERDLSLEVSAEARRLIADEGHDPAFGNMEAHPPQGMNVAVIEMEVSDAEQASLPQGRPRLLSNWCGSHPEPPRQ